MTGLEISLNKETDQVALIFVHRESYTKTAEGVRIGLSELAAAAKLGKPDSQGSFDDRGETDCVCYTTWSWTITGTIFVAPRTTT